jgi:hypothetical protein
MAVPLYMDHHVKAAVTNGLCSRGIDVITCAEDGMAEAEDHEILARATQQGRAVFTHDDDFLSIAHQWLHEGREFSGLVYAHQLGITIGQAIRDLELIATVLEPEEMKNRVEFLPFP